MFGRSKLQMEHSDQEFRLDFNTMSDKRCYILTGLHKNQFDELASSLPNSEPPVRIPFKQCLGFYLIKLRMGLSIVQLSALLEPSEYQMKKIVIFIRDLLYDEFTPINLGVKAISREEIIKNHTTTMSKVC